MSALSRLQTFVTGLEREIQGELEPEELLVRALVEAQRRGIGADELVKRARRCIAEKHLPAAEAVAGSGEEKQERPVLVIWPPTM